MPESAIADFVARYLPDSSQGVGPVRGRVLLSQKRLVLVSSAGRTVIPLGTVFDVVVGQVPAGLTQFFDDAMAIAYTSQANCLTATLEADGETITKFKTELFKALLQGTAVRIKHPARVGGRYTEERAREASLHIADGAVTFGNIEPTVRIDLSDVTKFRKTNRTFDGRVRPTLDVQFTDNGEEVTSEIEVDSSRRMNLLGRYLRLEYSKLVSHTRELDLSEEEIELLTAVYSGADEIGLSSVLGLDPDEVTSVLASLEEKRLLSSTEAGTETTSFGRLAVSERIEHVNG